MKKPLSRASALVALSLVTIWLGGCNTDAPGRKPNIAAGPVTLPRSCEKLLRNQAVVQAHIGDDYRVLFQRAQNGQIVENSTITQARRCMEYQRKLYSGAK